VPTWNYVAVHVHGTLQRLDDPGEVESVVARQVAMFEGGDAQAWRPAPETLARKLEGVTAFRLDVERVEAKLKLGQNRKLADRVAARVALGGAPRESDRELAAWMKSTEPDDDRRD
jgi:transcriptional regulator